MGVTVSDRQLVHPSVAKTPGRSNVSTILFTLTAFVGAGLLFVVQPLVARLVLPQYGGSATVWSTSSLFFQVVLLLGYLYVHATTTRLGRRTQLWLHLVVLFLPLLALPLALPLDSAPGDAHSPALWLLRTLAFTIGLPFAVIATTGPLLQRWYSWTVGPRSEDPYFLFAASNLGSFGGLIAYPLLVEPHLSLYEQRIAWTVGFGILIVLVASCGAVTLRSRPGIRTRRVGSGHGSPSVASRPSAGQYAKWLVLAFLPSTLMLGVTAHISTDVAAIPLMWVLPLGLYLATFVAAFARGSRHVSPLVIKAAVTLAALSCIAQYFISIVPALGLIVLDLTTLTVVAYAAHSRLAASRPATDHLTAFYLVVAAGGAFGGLLNGLLAPMLFDRIWEYPAALVGSTLLGIGFGSRGWLALSRRYHKRFVAVLEVALLFTCGLLALQVGIFAGRVALTWLVPAAVLLVLGIWTASRRTIPLAVALALLVTSCSFAVEGDDLKSSRTFYGTYRIKDHGNSRILIHGTTVHGMQYRDLRSGEPTTYYARSGPLGDLFEHMETPEQVGIVGLGTGTIAAYGTKGQTMTFFEIDPEMARIATDRRYFTYIADSTAAVHVVTGDGRLRLAELPRGKFDLLILDAFSSDAIPVHLLTREAFDMYADRLAPGGVLAVHLSNRVFDLEPVAAAAAHRLGWDAAVGVRTATGEGVTPTEWMVMSSDPSLISDLTAGAGWRPPRKKIVEWTDDYSSVLGVLRRMPVG